MLVGENIKVILSSPSGVCKTTITKKIQQKYHNFKISVSHTTRSPRSNEIDGIDYHFVSKEKFPIFLDYKNKDDACSIFSGRIIKNVKNTKDAQENNDLPKQMQIAFT